MADDVPLDNQSNCSRPEVWPVCCQDFYLCNRLRLELSPAVSDVNILCHRTQSSNEDEHVRAPGVELSDTGASFTLKMNCLSCRDEPESPKLLSLHWNSMKLNDDDDGGGEDANLSCLLNLSLASSCPSEVNNKNHKSVGENNEVRYWAPLKERNLGQLHGGRDLSSTCDSDKKRQTSEGQ